MDPQAKKETLEVAVIQEIAPVEYVVVNEDILQKKEVTATYSLSELRKELEIVEAKLGELDDKYLLKWAHDNYPKYGEFRNLQDRKAEIESILAQWQR